MNNPVRNFLLLCIPLLALACTKESFTNSSDALLQTSVDSLHFDTVFTTAGSTAQFVKIKNNNDKGIHISSIRLAGGSASPFKINVDGTAGPLVSNVDVLANDSAYLFVTVTINPTAANLPFVVRDSIEIIYNGNKKFIQLDAFGQNAHFFRGKVISVSEIWNNDLPYVILDGIAIAPNRTLTINKGCKIYMHADAPFIVQGTLLVNGGKDTADRVTFSGDRLDVPYRDFPASYPGLFFADVSKGSVLNYAVIKNAYQGVVVAEPSAGTKLTLNETIIDNAYNIGILGLNTSINARNVLVSNCGKNIVLVKGGNYNFTHCTVATFSNSYLQHKDPVLYASDFISQNNVVTTSPLNAVFRNCIFWGEANGFVKDEVFIEKKGTATPSLLFDNVLWRVQANPSLATITGNVINNINPSFDSISTAEKFYSFRLKEGSPAINKGGNAGVTLDLDGRTRPVGLPDLGAYEKQ